MEQQPYPGLEIEADLRQQRRDWVVERFSWLFLALLLIGIACGLFGRGGPLSERKLVSGDGRFQMQYERFIRYHSPDVLRMAIDVSAPSVRVRFDSGYVRHIRIERIAPQPDREISEDGAVIYIFEARPQTSMHATFYYAPEKFGRLDGWVSVNEGSRHSFSQFVYP